MLQVKLKYSIAVLTFILEIVFSFDNLKDSLDLNPKETMRLLVPVFIMGALGYLSSYLPSYESETIVLYFMY